MVTKRPAGVAFTPAPPQTPQKAPRRIKPSLTTMTTFRIDNIQDGETVHQTCLLIKGQCPTYDATTTDFVEVICKDQLGTDASVQNWPASGGKWKALALLQCGKNELTFKLHHAGGVAATYTINVIYQPLLQLPPLHLAIMLASDSPLTIDCPPAKYGAFTSSHSTINAAVEKFRMTALMWQALIAEDMRQKGLGRRSFRLEEEWTNDSLHMSSVFKARTQTPRMAAIPKVHVIRSERSLAELRDAQLAQQTQYGNRQGNLHSIFTQALKLHGSPFQSKGHPVVAGMILDSHFSLEHDFVLGHTAHGNHNDNDVSLATFGSHLTYSWPRFLDEVPSCLTDATAPGDTVSNENGECDTISKACFVSQGAFLERVGHAFGTDNLNDMMNRAYTYNWDHIFLARDDGEHVLSLDLEDVLKIKSKPHFRLPDDKPVLEDFTRADVRIEADMNSDDEDIVQVSCSAGLARVVVINGDDYVKTYSFVMPEEKSHLPPPTSLSLGDLADLDRSLPLDIKALGMNGKTKHTPNAWILLNNKSYISIPGTDVRLQKRSVRSSYVDTGSFDDANYEPWTVLLRKRGANGQLVRASAIDLRVGCTFDGAVVHYADGTHANCGPATDEDGSTFYFGGHASEEHDIPKHSKIVKVEIGERGGWGSLDGIRMTLDNGDIWGELNADGSGNDRVEILEPRADEKVVGFFGICGKANRGYTQEFGIITAPKGFKIPDVVYDMPELQNFEKATRMVDDDDAETSGSEQGDEEMEDEDEDELIEMEVVDEEYVPIVSELRAEVAELKRRLGEREESQSTVG